MSSPSILTKVKYKITTAISLPTPIPNLAGDRNLEWSFVNTCTGRFCSEGSRVLDFGAGCGILSFGAASTGAQVLAIDLMDCGFDLCYPNIEFRKANVVTIDPADGLFDLILNCSTIEHVGLSGRYNSDECEDGDLEAMHHMRGLLKLGGKMILTLPVGRDEVFKPVHRVYGHKRLPLLLDGYKSLQEIYWRKDSANVWQMCSQDEVFQEQCSPRYYGLGFFVLELD